MRFLFFLFLFFSSASFAAINFPELTGRVVDQANILDAATISDLDAKLAEHERKFQNQIVVVTLKDLNGQDIAEYGYQLGRHWAIGEKGKNNGALLIVAPNERKVRIESGYGLEGKLTDALSSLIISRAILPRFKDGDYKGGISEGVAAILSVLEQDEIPAGLQSETQEPAKLSSGLVILLIFLFLFLRRFGRSRRSGLLAPLILGGFTGGRSRGFRGGGGSFGGGGASGSW